MKSGQSFAANKILVVNFAGHAAGVWRGSGGAVPENFFGRSVAEGALARVPGARSAGFAVLVASLSPARARSSGQAGTGFGQVSLLPETVVNQGLSEMQLEHVGQVSWVRSAGGRRRLPKNSLCLIMAMLTTLAGIVARICQAGTQWQRIGGGGVPLSQSRATPYAPGDLQRPDFGFFVDGLSGSIVESWIFLNNQHGSGFFRCKNSAQNAAKTAQSCGFWGRFKAGLQVFQRAFLSIVTSPIGIESRCGYVNG